jgi:hypothetical protein
LFDKLAALISSPKHYYFGWKPFYGVQIKKIVIVRNDHKIVLSGVFPDGSILCRDEQFGAVYMNAVVKMVFQNSNRTPRQIGVKQ